MFSFTGKEVLKLLIQLPSGRTMENSAVSDQIKHGDGGCLKFCGKY